MAKEKKIGLKKAAEKLTDIAMKHLATIPEEEQEARVAAFARRNFKKRRGGHTTLSERPDTLLYRASARGRG